MYDSRDQRKTVESWVNTQEKCPSRKETRRAFPHIDMKHIRSAIQSRKDKERV